ncbi:hypothetical protein MJT46_005210 [Ovis ammon polii x Ovis aries]|nr:hypothetical protein MJT46_005210 [Ovis ammon polii x Ovis aries]
MGVTPLRPEEPAERTGQWRGAVLPQAQAHHIRFPWPRGLSVWVTDSPGSTRRPPPPHTELSGAKGPSDVWVRLNWPSAQAGGGVLHALFRGASEAVGRFRMKLNISFPATGCQKLIEVDDERKLRTFYEKRMATEVAADALGEEWKGYVVRISGGNDKQGFPMKQGVLTHGRVRLLLSKGHSCYRPRRTGERKRKSVRGCIVDANLSVLNLVIVKKGEKDIPGLTDTTVPRRLGPKRASRIRKLFNLSKEDDVRQYVVRKPLNKDGKKPRTKAPKIQRLVTPRALQHKRRRIALKKQRTKKNKEEAAEYAKLLAKRMKEAKEKRQEQIAKRRRLSSLRASTSKSESSQK